MKYLLTTLKKQIMNRSWTVAVGVGVLAFLVIGMLANAQSNSSRFVMLLPQAGAPFDIAGGHFILTSLSAGRFVEFSIHSLRNQSGSTAYAIYISTPSLGRFRMRTFNTSGGEQPASGFRDFGGVPDHLNPLWDTEIVTVEVYKEEDDGFDAPDVDRLLVLKGVNLP